MCKICEIESVYELTNKRKFCKKCFSRYFEKKVLHTIRKYNLLDNTKKIFVICTDINGEVISNILEKIAKKKNITISKRKNFVKIEKYEKAALGDSLDDVALLVVMSIMDKSPDFSFVGPKMIKKTKKGISTFIKPLYFCPDKEIRLYAKINNIKGNLTIQEKGGLKSKVADFIDFMEKKHPEIKNAVVNAMLEIMPALK